MSGGPAAVSDQRTRNLAEANAVRLEAARQLRELRGEPAAEIIAALRDPTPEFARYRLRRLFTPGGNGGSLVPRLGARRLHRVFMKLAADQSLGRLHWHPDLRLRELTRRERDRLVAELIAVAPKSWRASA